MQHKAEQTDVDRLTSEIFISRPRAHGSQPLMVGNVVSDPYRSLRCVQAFDGLICCYVLVGRLPPIASIYISKPTLVSAHHLAPQLPIWPTAIISAFHNTNFPLSHHPSGYFWRTTCECVSLAAKCRCQQSGQRPTCFLSRAPAFQMQKPVRMRVQGSRDLGLGDRTGDG